MKNSPSVEQDYEDEDFRLWVMLCQATDVASQAREKELSQYGITTRQAAVLHATQLIGNEATPAEIARRTLRQPHTVSSILSRMEEGGLLRKVKDLDKKNMIRIAITEKGQKAYRHSSKRKSLHQLMSSLSEEERQQLWSCLEKLRNRALRQLGVKYKPPFP